jgi:hypothetical protein
LCPRYAEFEASLRRERQMKDIAEEGAGGTEIAKRMEIGRRAYIASW